MKKKCIQLITLKLYQYTYIIHLKKYCKDNIMTNTFIVRNAPNNCYLQIDFLIFDSERNVKECRNRFHYVYNFFPVFKKITTVGLFLIKKHRERLLVAFFYYFFFLSI